MEAQDGETVTATTNLLLQQVSPAEIGFIRPHLQRVSIECGEALVEPDQAIDTIFFPESLVLAIEDRSDPARTVEVGLVGREGMIGWPALLGCTRSNFAVVAQMRGGTALRIPVPVMLNLSRAFPGLSVAMLQFVQMLTSQMARTIVSNLCDPIERRLCRWLLMRHDRIEGNELRIRHDEVSASLVVRRASITDALHVLEGEHLVRCHRGRIVIRDRPGLEARADTSYGAAEALYRAQIAPFGKGGAIVLPQSAPLLSRSPVGETAQ